MATYTQSNNSVGSTYYNYFLSHVPVGKDYIIFSTSDDYVLVYGDYDGSQFTDSTVYTIQRSYNNGTVDITNESTTTVNISYDYYTYSNIGHGTLLIQPDQTLNNNHIQHYTFTVLLVFLMFFIGFNVIKKRWIR